MEAAFQQNFSELPHHVIPLNYHHQYIDPDDVDEFNLNPSKTFTQILSRKNSDILPGILAADLFILKIDPYALHEFVWGGYFQPEYLLPLLYNVPALEFMPFVSAVNVLCSRVAFPEKDGVIVMISSIAQALQRNGFFSDQPVQAVAQLVTALIRYSLQDSEITQATFREMIKSCPAARSIPDEYIYRIYMSVKYTPLSLKFSFIDPQYERIHSGVLSMHSLEGRLWSSKVECIISNDTFLIYKDDKKKENIGGIILDNVEFISPVTKGDKMGPPNSFTIKSCMDESLCRINKSGKTCTVWFNAKTPDLLEQYRAAILSVSFKRMIDKILREADYSPCL